jgi:hypothetical protein
VWIALLKRAPLGSPMPLAQAPHERLNKTVALAVFASDPLSSVAYATEEILLVLVLAGIAALTSALPALAEHRVALANLRGVRESGRLFAAPTYFFVLCILGMVGYGLVAAWLEWLPEPPSAPHPPGPKASGSSCSCARTPPGARR